MTKTFSRVMLSGAKNLRGPQILRSAQHDTSGPVCNGVLLAIDYITENLNS